MQNKVQVCILLITRVFQKLLMLTLRLKYPSILDKKKITEKHTYFQLAILAAAFTVSLYKKSIINGWQRLFQEKRNIQNLFINLFFSSYSEHVRRVWRNTNIEERSKEEKKDQKENEKKLLTQPVISKTSKIFLEGLYIPVLLTF